MVFDKKISLIGGDKRQVHLFQKLLSLKTDIKTYGLEDEQSINRKFKTENLKSAVEFADYIILPIPISKNIGYLNAPLSKEKIKFDDEFISLCKDKVVFAGSMPEEIFLKLQKNNRVFDYGKQENFAALNAVPTAKGAIEIAKKEIAKSLSDCKCMITGFGKVGTELAKQLKEVCDNITICARSQSQLEEAKKLNYAILHLNDLKRNTDFDLIFNTIPAPIFDKNILKLLNDSTFIIDLASEPGAIDKIYAKENKIKFIHALGIPGKMYPKAAAEIIFDTIENIMREKNL